MNLDSTVSVILLRGFNEFKIGHNFPMRSKKTFTTNFF